MQLEEIFIWGEKTKEKPANFANRSVAKNAGFALLRQVG